MTTTDSDREAFLATIAANPDDMTPRLVFADWLDEREDARGEFIRVQIELASRHCSACEFAAKGPCEYCHETLAIRISERDLLQQHWLAWMPSGLSPIACGNRECFRGTLAPSNVHIVLTFRRGFVERVALPLQAWLDHGKRLVRELPLMTVRLSDREPYQWGDKKFAWMNGDEDANEDGTPVLIQDDEAIPGEIWSLLTPSPDYEPPRWKDYDSADAAHADVSQAALKWARGETKTPGPPGEN